MGISQDKTNSNRHNRYSLALSNSLFFIAFSACGGRSGIGGGKSIIVDDNDRKGSNNEAEYLSYSQKPYLDNKQTLIEKKFLPNDKNNTITLVVYAKIDNKEVSDEQEITLTSSTKVTSLPINEDSSPVKIPLKGVVIYKVNDSIMYEGVTPSIPYQGNDAKFTLTIATGTKNTIYNVKIKGQTQQIQSGQISEKDKLATSLAYKEQKQSMTSIKIYAKFQQEDDVWKISDMSQVIQKDLKLTKVFMEDGSAGNQEDWSFIINKEQVILMPNKPVLMSHSVDYIVLRDDENIVSIHNEYDENNANEIGYIYLALNEWEL